MESLLILFIRIKDIKTIKYCFLYSNRSKLIHEKYDITLNTFTIKLDQSKTEK